MQKNIQFSRGGWYGFMHYSFFVYCMHAPVITLTGMVYDPTLSILFNYEIVKYFTVVILAYIVCVLSAQFIERFSLDAGVLWMENVN